MAPSGGERLTSRRTGRSPSASERPEHVAQVRTRRTAAPDQPAADPSSIRSPAPTGLNESAITVGFNIEFFNTIRHDRIEAPWFLEGPIDGESFRLYVEKVLLPTLRP